MSDTYLVTGGAGFIGSHVVEELLRRGHGVRILDNFSTGRRSNIAHVSDDIEVVEGDLRSYERVHAAVRGTDRVIHLAALPSVPRSVQDPLTSNETNVTGTLNTLLAARDENVSRVVLASSSSVYGANDGMPKREDMVPQPISPYGVSKLAAEQYGRAFSSVYGLETVALRYFNVFGPRQDPNSQYSGVVPIFIRAAQERRECVVYGDGLQSRDFTYVTNVVDATLKAATVEGAGGAICNIGCGAAFTVLDLIAAVSKAAGHELRTRFEPPRPGDIKHSFADISLARSVLGYEPTVGFEQGVESTWRSLVCDTSDNGSRKRTVRA
ncbi:MAG TPA: SDR family oxidoreductase [Thermoleophilia bacterium]|nr:SDR family oxidoreductase [Thermoleophilia bacterium]